MSDGGARDAVALVDHLEHDSVIRRGEADLDLLTALGGLQRIDQQVDQDLLEQSRVTGDGALSDRALRDAE